MKKRLKFFQDVPAWLSLILAAHRVQLRGARRESPMGDRFEICPHSGGQCRYEPSPNILMMFLGKIS